MKIITLLLLLGMTASSVRAQNTQCRSGELDEFHDFGNRSDSFSFKPAKCALGRWVLDEDAWKKQQRDDAIEEAKVKAEDEHKVRLWNALRTRVITDAEMKELLQFGVEVIPSQDGGFREGTCSGSCGDFDMKQNAERRDAEMIFNNALLNQFKMRVMKAKP